MPRYLPSLLSGFSAAHPDIAVDFVEGDQRRIVDSLMTGETELALSYNLDLPTSVTAEQLVDLPPYAIVHRRHPFAARKHIALRQLAEDPVILLDMPISREYYASIFSLLNIRPNIRHRSTSVEAVRGLVANGLGVSVLTTRAAHDFAEDGREVVARPLRSPVQPQRVVLAQPVGAPAQPDLVAAFTRAARAVV